ncbi:MAG: 4Fe-4S binding protein [Deltaproteobacteria bacterium]|nr:4Fe-4S binding protein [Deltaproteobacteria bacterium]
MKSILRYGPNKKFVRFSVRLSWPLMSAARKLSAYPVLKWIINPFFAYPYNEVTAIPIGVEIPQPDNVILPRAIVEHVIKQASEIFILDECICRSKCNCTNHPIDIGCMALGKGAQRIHPSHGHKADHEEAVEHVRKAAHAGLIPSIAHTWIDPVAFGLPDFRHLMFICFCDDCCCLYRTHMKNRGPNLDKAYKGLPGISVQLDENKCNGCGICAQHCFVAAIDMVEGIPRLSESCKSCGRCVDVCPENALSLNLAPAEELFDQIMIRINKVADISSM